MTLVPFRELLVMADSVVVQLQAILEPRLVAVIGASNDHSTSGSGSFYRTLGAGIRGHLYSVDSGRTESFGVQAYRSVLGIDADVDLAVIATYFPMELQAVEDCIQKVEASIELA